MATDAKEKSSEPTKTVFVVVEKTGYCFLGSGCKMHSGERTHVNRYMVHAICDTLDRAKILCDTTIENEPYDAWIACLYVNEVKLNDMEAMCYSEDEVRYLVGNEKYWKERALSAGVSVAELQAQLRWGH